MGEWVKKVKGDKRSKLPVIKYRSHGEVVYSTENIVNSIVITVHGDRWLQSLV